MQPCKLRYLFLQEVLWRADWVVFCLARCLHSAPHPSLCPGHLCLPIRYIHCGCQCAKVSGSKKLSLLVCIKSAFICQIYILLYYCLCDFQPGDMR